MTKRDVFSLIVKTVGIWTLVIHVPGIFSRGGRLSSILDMVPLFISISMGALFLFLSDRISACVIKNDITFSLPGWLSDKNEVFQFSLKIFAVFLLGNNLPYLIYSISAFLRAHMTTDLATQISVMNHIQGGQVVVAGLSIVIGAILLFGLNGIDITMKGRINDNE